MRLVFVLFFLIISSVQALDFSDTYWHRYLFDGELLPVAFTVDAEIDINTPQNFSFGAGGAPISLVTTNNGSLNVGIGYRYKGISGLDSLSSSTEQLQSLNFNLFGTGEWTEKWWWIGYLQYGFSADTLFNSNAFSKGITSYLGAVGYRPNDRFTFGLSLLGRVGPEGVFALVPIPTIRAALVPQKLWVNVGPLAEAGITWRATERFLTSGGFRLGGDAWYLTDNGNTPLEQSLNALYLNTDFKVGKITWAYAGATIPVSNTFTYDEGTQYPQHGTVFLRAGVKFTLDWFDFRE